MLGFICYHKHCKTHFQILIIMLSSVVCLEFIFSFEKLLHQTYLSISFFIIIGRRIWKLLDHNFVFSQMFFQIPWVMDPFNFVKTAPTLLKERTNLSFKKKSHMGPTWWDVCPSWPILVVKAIGGSGSKFSFWNIWKSSIRGNKGS